jgi:hypothetical protein
MLFEILKIVATLLGGGLAGAFLTGWNRRRNSRVQAIPLFERVNRLVNPKLQGFTLARVAGEGADRRLEEIQNVRDYQFTLRNTSTVHLQDAEVQFEFPADDVEAWAERPVLSKTPPLLVDAVVAEPWKKGYRWRIPQFPSTDSMEFTFRAVDPTSDGYEVALYKSERVVIEKVRGSVGLKKTYELKSSALSLTLGLAICFLAFLGPIVLIQVIWHMGASHNSYSANLSEAGCSLHIESHYYQADSSAWPWQGPWEFHYSVLNVGSQKCVVQSEKFLDTPVSIEPGQSQFSTGYSKDKPKLVQRDLSFGSDGPTHKSTVSVYAQVQP